LSSRKSLVWRLNQYGSAAFCHSPPSKAQAAARFHRGSAWAHADGNGFNIQLETVPLDGRIALRVASEKAK